MDENQTALAGIGREKDSIFMHTSLDPDRQLPVGETKGIVQKTGNVQKNTSGFLIFTERKSLRNRCFWISSTSHPKELPELMLQYLLLRR